MDICSEGHEEVCFESGFYSRKCPVCDMREDKNCEIQALEDQIKGLEAELEEYHND